MSHQFSKPLFALLISLVVSVQVLHAEGVIWRNLPVSSTMFPVPNVVKKGGPGPGGTFERRYLLSRVLVDTNHGNAGTVDSITAFFVDDAPMPFGAMNGVVRLNVFETTGPNVLPTTGDDPDNGLLLPATFTQNLAEGWIEVTVTDLSSLPIPIFINLGVPYYIGITPVLEAGNEPFSGLHLCNQEGKAMESQSAYRETSPMPIDWMFAGDLFGPPRQLFASIEILRRQPLCSPDQPPLSQNNDATTITPFNSVSCNAGGIHASNSYYRSFDMSATVGDYKVSSVSLGIEVANGNGAGDIPVDVNFYWNTPINGIVHHPLGSQGQDASVSTTIPGDGSANLSVIEIPTPGVVIPDFASQLVVEIFTPGLDGPNPLGQSLFVGSNANGQTGPTYLAAAACGITLPTPTVALGFPNMHMVLVVNPCTLTGCGFPLGDVNLDGIISLLDVAPFVALLTSGTFQCEADINGDGAVTLLDVAGFVAILTGG